MASLQTLAETVRSREEVGSRPRTLVIANERSLGVLTVRHDDAKHLIRDGLVYECPSHDLHLIEYRDWELDDVERLLIAISRFDRKKHDGALPSNAAIPPLTLDELRRRAHPVYQPAPLPFSTGEASDAAPVTPSPGAPLLCAIAAGWVVVMAAFLALSGRLG